jgi:hypothetical protein
MATARRDLTRALPWAVCGACLLVVLIGLLTAAAGGQLGSALPPFVMRWGPQVSPKAVFSCLAIGGALALVPVIGMRLRAGWPVAGALYGLSLVLALGLNLAHEGFRGWWAMFSTGSHGSFEGHFEYLLGLPQLRAGVGWYLAHFAQLFPWFTTHIKGNPPGPLIALHLLGIHTAPQLAALCIVIGSLCAPLAYDLGRVVGGEEQGRVAGLLTCFAPSMLLFGVSSLDFVFAALGMGAACLLARPGGRALVTGAVVAALGSFFSWLLLAIPAWAVVLAWQRAGRRRAAAVAAACGLAVVAMNATLLAVYGYDPFAALSATATAYRHGVADVRPYAFWVVGSPAAWAVMVGLPIVWLSLRALARRDPVAVSLWLLLAVASILGLTKAETERIWLPFVPLACVAAASRVPVSRVRPLLLALALQALAIEVIFFTIW